MDEDQIIFFCQKLSLESVSPIHLGEPKLYIGEKTDSSKYPILEKCGIGTVGGFDVQFIAR